MREEIAAFEDYLRTVKRSSKNTVAAYGRDLAKLENFMKEQGATDVLFAVNAFTAATPSMVRHIENIRVQ